VRNAKTINGGVEPVQNHALKTAILVICRLVYAFCVSMIFGGIQPVQQDVRVPAELDDVLKRMVNANDRNK